MKKRRDILVYILGGVLFVFAAFSTFKSCLIDSESRDKKSNIEEEESLSYYSKYKIVLKGKVISKSKVGDGRYELYYIKVAQSNVSHHDLRGYNEDYYLVVNSDTARMVDARYIANINDSILVDYNAVRNYVWNQEPPKYGKTLPFFTMHYRSYRIKGFGW